MEPGLGAAAAWAAPSISDVEDLTCHSVGGAGQGGSGVSGGARTVTGDLD